jgi:hypothetical protein|nr:MAG TPA: N-formylglutamate amidohydrolase [Ackermannviridae sp.]
MSFSEDLVKNYKARQKAIKEIKEDFKSVLGVPFELNKQNIINAYISGKAKFDVGLTEEQKKTTKEFYDNYYDYKDETFRELLEEKGIAVIVDWFNIRAWSDEGELGYISIIFSEDSKKEQDKKLKEN